MAQVEDSNMTSKLQVINIKPLHLNGKFSSKFSCASLAVQQKLNPKWSSEVSYGKMDEIATFSNVTREIDFSFVTRGKQKNTAINLHNNINNLMKSQYPKYINTTGGTKTLSAPPFFEISVLNGKLYSTVQGYINSLDVKPGSATGVTAMGTEEGVFYERQYDVTIGFVVLHKTTPGWTSDTEFTSRGQFIFSSDPKDKTRREQEKITAFNVANALGAGLSEEDSMQAMIEYYASLRDD